MYTHLLQGLPEDDALICVLSIGQASKEAEHARDDSASTMHGLPEIAPEVAGHFPNIVRRSSFTLSPAALCRLTPHLPGRPT